MQSRRRGAARRRARPGRQVWRGLAAASLAVGAAATLAGCGNARRGVAPPQQTTTTLGPRPTVRIGYLGDQRGGGTVAARAVKRGELLAVQQYRGRSGSVDAVMVERSTGGTTRGAAAAARRLVADHVVAVVGPQSMQEAEGAAPVLAAAGIPDLSPTLTAATLPAGWKDLVRVAADDAQQGTLEAEELVARLGRDRVALVSGTGTGDRARTGAAATEIGSRGAAVTVQVLVGATGRDLSRPGGAASAGAQVVRSGADGVLVSAPPAATRAVVRALRSQGFQGSILVATDVDTTTGILRPLGAAADGVLVASPAPDSSAQTVTGGEALDFRDTFRAAFGRVPPRWSAEAYDATEWVLAAVQAGGTTPAQVAGYLAGHPWDGVTTTLAWGPAGTQLHPRVWICRIRRGLAVQVGEVG